MFPLWSKIQNVLRGNSQLTNTCLALDIGTHMVKVLLFEQTENGKGRVIGVGKAKQNLQDMHAGTVSDIEGVVNTAALAIEEAEEMAGLQANQVIMGIAGELVKGATTVVGYERPKPTEKITLKELTDIVRKVQWQAFDQMRRKLSVETGYQEIEIQLVNAAIVNVEIDGYQVHNPIGFQGKTINVSVFNSFAPLVHLGALQTVAEDLELDLLSIACEPFAVAASHQPEELGEYNTIFIDIGGGTTDIAVIKNGGITGTKMFSLGGRAFTRRLSQYFNLPFKNAEKLKLDYSLGQLDGDTQKLIGDVLLSDAEVWLSGVELTLEELNMTGHLPSRILLCGGGSRLPQIQQVLKEHRWGGQLTFVRKPDIHFLQPTDVANIEDQTTKLNSSQDITPLGLAHLALDLMGEERLVDRLLRKASSAMRK